MDLDDDMRELSNLDDQELLEACQNNEHFTNICDHQTFWKTRIMKKFPYLDLAILEKNKGNRTWSDYYINDLRKINETNAEQYMKNGSRYKREDYMIIGAVIMFLFYVVYQYHTLDTSMKPPGELKPIYFVLQAVDKYMDSIADQNYAGTARIGRYAAYHCGGSGFGCWMKNTLMN